MAGALLCGFVAGAQTESGSSLAELTTRQGQTYKNVVILKVEPDGIIVSYQPGTAGFGLAKLPFLDLPEPLRERYGYDAGKAAEFAAQRAQATAQWRAQLLADDGIRQYRALAQLHRALVGDGYSSYTVSLDGSGRVSAQSIVEPMEPRGMPPAGASSGAPTGP
jgi:hypothetical protein